MEFKQKRYSEKLVFKMIKAYKNRNYRLSKIYSLCLRVIFSCDVVGSIEFDNTSQLVHNGLGCVFHPKASIGKNCRIYQNVTLGGNGIIKEGKTQTGAPKLKDNVTVFAGACILGPIEIGEGSIIAANAVVTKNVPPHSLVIGNPSAIKELKFEYGY